MFLFTAHTCIWGSNMDCRIQQRIACQLFPGNDREKVSIMLQKCQNQPNRHVFSTFSRRSMYPPAYYPTAICCRIVGSFTSLYLDLKKVFYTALDKLELICLRSLPVWVPASGLPTARVTLCYSWNVKCQNRKKGPGRPPWSYLTPVPLIISKTETFLLIFTACVTSSSQ